MTTQTRSTGKFGAVMLLIALVTIFVVVLKKAPSDDKPRQVNILVSWLPSPRTPLGTEVKVALAGAPVAEETSTTAPWLRSFTATPGQRIDVWTALLGAGPGFLGCKIQIDGVSADDEHGDMQAGQILHCWALA